MPVSPEGRQTGLSEYFSFLSWFFPKKMNAKEYLQSLKSSGFDRSRLVYLSSKAKTFRAEVEREAREDPAKSMICKWVFGKDPYCLNWDYKAAKLLPYHDDFYVMGPASVDFLASHKKEVLLFNCLYIAYGVLAGDAAQYCTDYPEALFLLKGGLQGFWVDKTALFRVEMVWPHWGSTQAFWEDMVSVWEESEWSYNVSWPEDAPKMTAGQVLDFFEEEGFERGLKFVKLIITRCGPDFKLSDVAVGLPFLVPEYSIVPQ